MSNISRRQFLKSAGVATLAVAAAGVLAGCSKEDIPEVPVIPEVTTRPVMAIFMEAHNNQTTVVGEPVKLAVLKTAKTVKVGQIDKKLIPEGYALENENAEVEIRNDATKGEHIFVFVTDVKHPTVSVDIQVGITNPKAGEAVRTTVKATVKEGVTTISAREIALPDGFTWAEGTDMDRQYDIATYVFPISHIE